MEILDELDMCIQDIPHIMLNKYMLPFLMGTMKNTHKCSLSHSQYVPTGLLE